MQMTISPSLLAADFACLRDELENIKRGGADMLHLDIMDGHFVPNISFGMPVLAALRKVSDLFFDVHIMISQPMRYLEALRASGADLITFHCEAEGDPIDTINAIHAMGCKAGISLSPDTPVEHVLPYIGGVDLVLIMTVVPGFGGQKYIKYCSEKIRQVKELSEKYNKDLLIQVDGGVTADNIKEVVSMGANVIVAGSAVFKNGTIKENIAQLRRVL